MIEAIETARANSEHPTRLRLTGLRAKKMRALRALGRTLLDTNMLVFNMGRGDFRRKHLVGYAMELQTSTKGSRFHCQSMETAVGVACAMFASIS